LRRRRIHKQLEVNPGLTYGNPQHQVACTEIALILKVFGDGQKVRCDYIRALFQEERLPIQEGWKKRRWWSIGFLELMKTATRVKKVIGIEI
jgi:Peroxidase, family 2